MQRQCNSALYEHLLLSADKDKVDQPALEGQTVEMPKNVMKDPYVLEFLGLPELPSYSETELESWISDHLQQFLLELDIVLSPDIPQKRRIRLNEII